MTRPTINSPRRVGPCGSCGHWIEIQGIELCDQCLARLEDRRWRRPFVIFVALAGAFFAGIVALGIFQGIFGK